MAGTSHMTGTEHVILLHGLCRTSRSMRRMAAAVKRAGYVTWNIDYPSRTAPIDVLSEQAVGGTLQKCREHGATRVHFVTHSMGGILVRSYCDRHAGAPVGRVLMLAPPNGGSEVVDRLKGWRLFRRLNGPAGSQLGTEPGSVPNTLGPARFELGIIAGSRSINLINSWLIALSSCKRGQFDEDLWSDPKPPRMTRMNADPPVVKIRVHPRHPREMVWEYWLRLCRFAGRNDGKVSIERTKLEGMADHLVIPSAHPFIMRHPEAIRQALAFLSTGRFARVAP